MCHLHTYITILSHFDTIISYVLAQNLDQLLWNLLLRVYSLHSLEISMDEFDMDNIFKYSACQS